ncbi:hypothetical protein B7463_g12743, partial [Scytalidium lignicola]
MKYAERLLSESVPQWAIYNIEYNKLKNLIKVHTKKDQGQAIAISGQDDIALKFEDLFFNELCYQHDYVDLFVKSKAGEISRRLQWTQKAILRSLTQCINNSGQQISTKRRARCGDDVKSLSHFVDAQCMAFYKILKKYTKWTGSQTLSARFKDEVLGSPKSFINCNFEPLVSQHDDILTTLRASTPASSEPVTLTTRPRQPSVQTPVQEVRQMYWNEYDNGSEVENELHTIYVDLDAELIFPGAQTVAYVTSRAKVLMEKIKGRQNPTISPDKQRSLLKDSSYFTKQVNLTRTDIGKDNCASSSNFSGGYATHYATFPSTSDQKPSQYRERLLFQGVIGGFVAALLVPLVASILILTDRHRLRIEVNTEVVVGVVVSVVASLFFATLGFRCILYRKERLDRLYRVCVGVTFIVVCLLNGLLLVLVVGNTGL